MITVFTTQTCAYCAMVKKYFDAKKIEYTTVDVTDDEQTRNELLEKTGMSAVPVTTNGTDYVVGFNPAQLAKLVS